MKGGENHKMAKRKNKNKKGRMLDFINSSWPGVAYMRHEKQPSFP